MGRSAGGGGRSPVRSLNVRSGNLSKTERRAIVEIINRGLTEGRVGRTNYFISRNGDTYTARVQRRDRGLGFIGEQLRTSTYTSTFTVSR